MSVTFLFKLGDVYYKYVHVSTWALISQQTPSDKNKSCPVIVAPQ